MKRMKYYTLTLFSLLTMNSCVKNFLGEGSGFACENEVEATTTMEEVYALYDGSTRQIMDDLVLEGYVISSDEHDNFFGSLHFQDHPSEPRYGLQLEIDLPEAYLWYPPGTRILIKLKGLYLGSRKGVLMLGGAFQSFGNTSVGRLPARLVAEHLMIPCGEPGPLVPVTAEIEDLADMPVNTLVSVLSVQLIDDEKAQPYAPAETTETERTLENCAGNLLSLFNSAYASFASDPMPSGRGTVTGVYLRENNKSFLRLRDTRDMETNDERCIDEDVPGETEADEESPTGEDEEEEPTSVQPIFITELADPENNTGARFLELHNAGDSGQSLDGWSINRYTNANAEIGSVIDLTGYAIPAAGFLLISPDAAEFLSVYGLQADLEAPSNSAADSNGDDTITLVNEKGELIDIFGRIGEDGSGTDHEFEDGKAERIASVIQGNPVYDPMEWVLYNDTGASGTINAPQLAPQDFTPGLR